MPKKDQKSRKPNAKNNNTRDVNEKHLQQVLQGTLGDESPYVPEPKK